MKNNSAENLGPFTLIVPDWKEVNSFSNLCPFYSFNSLNNLIEKALKLNWISR